MTGPYLSLLINFPLGPVTIYVPSFITTALICPEVTNGVPDLRTTSCGYTVHGN